MLWVRTVLARVWKHTSQSHTFTRTDTLLAWNEGYGNGKPMEVKIEKSWTFILKLLGLWKMGMFQSCMAIWPKSVVSLWRQERHLSLCENSSCFASFSLHFSVHTCTQESSFHGQHSPPEIFSAKTLWVTWHFYLLFFFNPQHGFTTNGIPWTNFLYLNTYK